ncbi:hypothetical protein U1Q18_052208, partial [Sarracenia purpurea var. burkii]
MGKGVSYARVKLTRFDCALTYISAAKLLASSWSSYPSPESNFRRICPRTTFQEKDEKAVAGRRNEG